MSLEITPMILLHTGYHFFLPVACDHGDLGQVYPIARGSAPILVTVGAVLFAGELLDPVALATAACIAAYTVVDGLGARRAGSVLGFGVWRFVSAGLVTFGLILSRGQK